MNILAQYGTFRFYENKSSRQWDNTENENIVVFFEINKIPMFELATATSSLPVMSVHSIDDTKVSQDITISDIDNSTYFLISNKIDIVLAGAYEQTEDGYFYIKVTSGANTYYSDVFGWASDVSKYLKISASTAPFAVGIDSEYTFGDIDYVCYLSASYNGIIPTAEEDAKEMDGITIPYYTSLSKQRNWIIDGNEYIYEFMLGLRVLTLNGAAEVVWNGITFSANDILVELSESWGGADIITIDLKFVAGDDIMKVINTSE